MAEDQASGAMDIMQLYAVLGASLSQDTAQRKAAEDTLQQVAHQTGHLSNLLRLTMEDSADEAVRQVAAISLKNLVKKDWECEYGEDPRLSAADQAAVRENLVAALVATPPAVRAQLGEAAKQVVHHDFPDRWPALLPTISTLIATPERGAQLYAALLMLRLVARKYEFKDDDDREPLNELVASTFPRLCHIFQGLVASGDTSTQTANLMKLVLKTFWSAIFLYMPPSLAHPHHFGGWMTCLYTFIVAPVPTEGEPQDVVLRAAWPWWKAKKWALHISHRLFDRYGDPKHCRDRDAESAFAMQFRDECSIKYLEAHMALLGRYAEGVWIAPRVINLALQYMTVAIKAARTWKILQPHVPQLMARVLFPLMCFNDEDAELWADDPQEYVRKGYDIMEEMYSAKSAASNFLHELCKSRPKNMKAFMDQVTAIFAQYRAAASEAAAAVGGPHSVPQEIARSMDGALLAVGALSDILKQKAEYKAQLEGMLAGHVAPLFSSPHGHLRAKACWLTGVFADTKFASGFGSGPVFEGLFRANVNCLSDADMPVRVGAVMSARFFIDAYDSDNLHAVKSLIPTLLDKVFKLMTEVDNEDLVLTLEAVVGKFEEDMTPYAANLTHHLAASFWRATQAQETADSDDEGMAAFNTIRTICTVLDSVSTKPALFPQLEEIVFPILHQMLSEDGQDVFEEVLEILAYVSYCGREVSPRLWQLWPQLVRCMMEWGADFWEAALVPLDNFISRDTHTFLTCKSPDYLASANQLAETTLGDDSLQEEDALQAAKLLEIIMLNCRGRVDQCVPSYITIAFTRLPSARNKFFQDVLLNVVATAFHYNASLAMRAVVATSEVEAAFSTWLGGIHGKGKRFRRMYDKKVQVLGLLAVATLPESDLPPQLAAGFTHLLLSVLHLLSALRIQEVSAQTDSDDSIEGTDEEEERSSILQEFRLNGVGGDDEGLGDDEDEREDHGYLERLARARQREKDMEARGQGDSDEDSDWTEDEEEGTPIDTIDPFAALATAVALLQQRGSPQFQAFAAALTPQQTAELQGLLQFAQERPPAAPPQQLANSLQ